MGWQYATVAVIVALSSGCSAADIPNEKSSKQAVSKAPTEGAEPETIKTESGLTFAVERVLNFKATDLPQNNDLKMADGDLVKYGVEGCTLSARPRHAPSQCDVYVQADKSGTLIGYAFVYKEPKGVFFYTNTALNEQKEPGGGSCLLSGPIYDEKSKYQQQMVADPSQDFEGRDIYSVTTNGDGNDIVSSVDPNNDTNTDGTLGVWYIKRQGDKLRITQERWNYCYKKSDVYIDDVFYRAVSLTRL